jgi:hypothetical protein
MEVSVHEPAALPTGKDPRYRLDKMLGGFQSQFGRDGEDKILQFLPGMEHRSSSP